MLLNGHKAEIPVVSFACPCINFLFSAITSPYFDFYGLTVISAYQQSFKF